MIQNSILQIEKADQKISSTIEAKKHEDFAQMLEFQLRTHFNRQNIWVISHEQKDKANKSYPCIRVIDNELPENIFRGAVSMKAEEIVPDIYGMEHVYVATDSTSVMPDGDSLKYVIDHLLSLQFGHHDYQVEFDTDDEDDAALGHVEIYIDNLGTASKQDRAKGFDTTKIPNEVIYFVFEKAKELRPDLEFKMSDQIRSITTSAYYAPGYLILPSP